jgi:hypothetical protein
MKRNSVYDCDSLSFLIPTSVGHLDYSPCAPKSLATRQPSRTIYLRPTLILSSHLCLGLPGGFHPSNFPIKCVNLYSINVKTVKLTFSVSGYSNQYRDSLRARRFGVRTPVGMFFLTRPYQPPIKWVTDLFPGCTAAGALRQPATSI